jgi:hypothetical protein
LPQMFGNGRPRNGKRFGDLARGLRACSEEIEHGSSRGIGQSMKGSLGRICNRTVPHDA